MILCLYAYYERDDTYKENCEYFIKNGVNSFADYVFIVNGNHTVTFPPNVKVLQRDNQGYDFGAWSMALDMIDLSKYKFFIFVNSSVKGPYIMNLTQPWQHRFISMINGDTKLVGTTINILTYIEPGYRSFFTEKGFRAPYSHVQTQVFAMDDQCLAYLKDKIFIDQDNHTFIDLIYKKEVAMSQYVLQHGWNINCLAPKYKGLDYRTMMSDINPTSLSGDANFAGHYFGGTLSPEEIMFVKTNRNYTIEFFADNARYGRFWLPLIFMIALVCFILWYLKNEK